MRRWPMRLAVPEVSGAPLACMRRKLVSEYSSVNSVVVALAELLAQLEERAVPDLLADGDPGAEVPRRQWSS